MGKRDYCLTLMMISWTVGILYWTSTLTANLQDFDDQTLVVQSTIKPTEEKIIQKLPPPKIRFSVEKEIEMACEEVDCVKNCQTQFIDKKDKFETCKKQCSIDRCKLRCKKEPNPSYVERELKKEKCMDRCKETDTKCKTNCENESKRCKDRCKERSQKYFCVRDLDNLPQEEDIDETIFQEGNGPI